LTAKTKIIITRLNRGVSDVAEWLKANLLRLNPAKPLAMWQRVFEAATGHGWYPQRPSADNISVVSRHST